MSYITNSYTTHYILNKVTCNLLHLQSNLLNTVYQRNLQKALSSTNVWLSSWCIFPSCLSITSDKIKTLHSRGLIMHPTFLWLEWSSRFQSGFGEKWEVCHHWLLIHSWIKNLLWGYELDKVNYKKIYKFIWANQITENIMKMQVK